MGLKPILIEMLKKILILIPIPILLNTAATKEDMPYLLNPFRVMKTTWMPV